jgi:predicted MFS family arabinose efflux permease
VSSFAQRAEESRSFRALFVAALLLLLAASGTTAWLAIDGFEQKLRPEIERKSAAVGAMVAREIGRAVTVGVPFDKLYGMGPFLQEAIRANDDLARIEVLAPDGKTRFAAGDLDEAEADDGDRLDLPITLENGRVIGSLRLHVDPAFVESQLAGILYDVLIILVVSLLIAVEALLILFNAGLRHPSEAIDRAMTALAEHDFRHRLMIRADGSELGRVAEAYNDLTGRLAARFEGLRQEAIEIRAGHIRREIIRRIDGLMADLGSRFRFPEPAAWLRIRPSALDAVRAPLFVFILAEEMSRAFLPVYIKSLAVPIPGFSLDTVIGLPITVFMAAIALVTPWAGRLTDRLGARRTFLIGMAPSVLGFVGTAFAASVLDLLLWRGLCGIGYAIVYIACQGHVARHSTAANRTRGMATFMGAVFAAGVCGPALGGILVDQTDYTTTFLVSAGLVILSGLTLVWLLGSETLSTAEPVRRRLRLADFRLLAGNPRFLALTVFVAIPGKVALTGFLFYLAPLYLNQLGNSSAETGRIIMVYGVATTFLTPLVANLADRTGRPALLVIVGGLVAGLGLLTLLIHANTRMVLACVLLLGIGHALSIAPQLALATALTTRESAILGPTTVLSIYRLIERSGNIAGPLVTAALLSVVGPPGAIAAIGLLVAAGAVLFGASTLRADPEPLGSMASETR